MIDHLQERTLKLLFILIWLLALVHMSAEYYHLYFFFPWFDIVTHFLGGLWVGIATVWVWYFSGYLRKAHLPDRNSIYVALLGGLVVGIVWELYQYVIWMLTDVGIPLGYIGDTILDLVMDVVGAGVGSFILQYFIFEKQLEILAE